MRPAGKTQVGAFTMVELMGAVTISISLILMLYTIFDKVTKVFVEGQSRAVAMEEGRSAMDMIVADIQRMGAVIDGDELHLEWVPFIYEPIVAKQKSYSSYIDTTDYRFPPIPSGEYFITNSVSRILPKADFLVAGSAGASPIGSTNSLYHHNIRFYSHTDSWRLIHYKLGAADNYVTQLQDGIGTPVHLKDTPVGALWVYRSLGRLKGEVKSERDRHKKLIENDASNGGRLAFAKLIGGVIHFRVRAINPGSKEFPGRVLAEIEKESNPFKAGVLPTHVEVELAVLDRNLLKKIQAGMEQELEGLTEKQKRDARLEEIRNNLDRVYFFKQLVKIKGGGKL